MSHKYPKWAFIKNKITEEPALVALKSDKILWNGGPSYCYLDSTFEIIQEFNVNLHNYDDEIDRLTILFNKEYPPNCEVLPSGGWLAPSGKFYPCFYCEHDKTANRITCMLYDKVGNGAVELENRGWLHVSEAGYVLRFNRSHVVTQAQIDTLMDMYTMSTDESYKTCLMHDIKRFSDY